MQIWTVEIEDWRLGADWRFISRKVLSLPNTPILTSMTGDLAPETQKWYFIQAEESCRNVLFFYYYCSGATLFLASGTQKWFLYQAGKSRRILYYYCISVFSLLHWSKSGSSIKLRSPVGITHNCSIFGSGEKVFLAPGTQNWFFYQSEKSSRNAYNCSIIERVRMFSLLLGLNIASSIRLRSVEAYYSLDKYGVMWTWSASNKEVFKKKKKILQRTHQKLLWK